MEKMLTVFGIAGALVAGVASPAIASGPAAISEGARVVVYVESQDLYFDSLVTHPAAYSRFVGSGVGGRGVFDRGWSLLSARGKCF